MTLQKYQPNDVPYKLNAIEARMEWMGCRIATVDGGVIWGVEMGGGLGVPRSDWFTVEGLDRCGAVSTLYWRSAGNLAVTFVGRVELE